jgi:hypothetical protein
MSKMWHVGADGELIVAAQNQRGQASLFEPGTIPVEIVRGQGPPAAGPARDFIQLLYRARIHHVVLSAEMAPAWIRKQRLAPGNESRLLHSLRWLGLLRADGSPDVRLWSINRRSGRALLEMLRREAYAELEMMLAVTPEEVTIHHWYAMKGGTSSQLAEAAVALYLRVLVGSGMEELVPWKLEQAVRKNDWRTLLPAPAAGARVPLRVVTGGPNTMAPRLKQVIEEKSGQLSLFDPPGIAP